MQDLCCGQGAICDPVCAVALAAFALCRRYESFDDYLELVVEFGYITLFASAFPLASALSIFCNLIELKSDMFKLTFITRRPPASRAASIGTWHTLLTAQVWLSIVTNCLIFALSSNQMAEYFPWLFHESDKGLDLMKVGSGRIVVGLAWAIEHAVVLIALFLWFVVDSRPEWVRMAVARDEYEALRLRKQRYAAMCCTRGRVVRGCSADG